MNKLFVDIESGGFKSGEMVVFAGRQTGKSMLQYYATTDINLCKEILMPKKKFDIDTRYNMIVPHWANYDEMLEWAEEHSTLYTVYATGIRYHSEKALSFFLLRWA